MGYSNVYTVTPDLAVLRSDKQFRLDLLASVTRRDSLGPAPSFRDVYTFVSEQTRTKYAGQTAKAPVIDCSRAGYYKVLGKGVLPKQPVIVKARFFSRIAEEKIKAVGGACILS